MFFYYVYIVANKNNKTIYVGVTNNLVRRISEHKQGLNDSFTKKYNVDKLVYAEKFDDINLAIAREKQIKGWVRSKKDELINSINPEWKELSPF